MKKYCFDTSGITNPLNQMPSDIHERLWERIQRFIQDDEIAVTTEIYDELKLTYGPVGDCVRTHRGVLLLEVGNDNWNWQDYVANAAALQLKYAGFISENLGGRKDTVGLNDVSIIALAKTLGLPLVSMESSIGTNSPIKRRIPDICSLEKVEHLTFNDFLRREGVRV